MMKILMNKKKIDMSFKKTNLEEKLKASGE